MTLGYAVTEQQSQRLNAALADLLVLSEAEAVFMSDYGGNLVAYSTSETADDSIYTIAALAAGSFSATRELASLVKEPAFRSIFHQGEKSSIYMQSLISDFLILVIFGKRTTAGLVKLYVEKAGGEIEPIIMEMSGQSIAAAGGPGKVFEMNEGDPVFRTRDEA